MFDDPVSEFALVAAIGWGSLVVVAVFVLTFLGAVYGLKTRKGSGINEHPGPDSGDPVTTRQSERAETLTGREDGPGGEKERDSTLERRGTK